MRSVASAGCCLRRRGIASCGLPGGVKDVPVRAAAADESASKAMRVHDSLTRVNFMGYEDHVFAERFDGYQVTEPEVIDVRRIAAAKRSGGSTVKGPAHGSIDVTQCIQMNAPRREAIVSRALAVRISLVHNVGGVPARSVGTILEGPTAHGS
jgi:hypothetical protein